MQRKLINLTILPLNTPKEFRGDYYHQLLKISWPKFIGMYIIFFLGVNVIFGHTYFLLQTEMVSAYTPTRWIDYFDFSVQTFSTIGYGAIYPKGTISHLIVVLESMCSLLTTALMAGLFFARLSKPTARFMFSKNILITTFTGKRILMFRVANARINKVMSANASLHIAYNTVTAEGIKFRRFQQLKLQRKTTPLFALTWTIMHTIDEKSPLFNKTWDDLQKEGVDFSVTIEGIDETFGQAIHAHNIYSVDSIVFDKQFHDIWEIKDDGLRVIDYQYFDTLI